MYIHVHLHLDFSLEVVAEAGVNVGSQTFMIWGWHKASTWRGFVEPIPSIFPFHRLRSKRLHTRENDLNELEIQVSLWLSTYPTINVF